MNLWQLEHIPFIPFIQPARHWKVCKSPAPSSGWCWCFVERAEDHWVEHRGAEAVAVRCVELGVGGEVVTQPGLALLLRYCCMRGQRRNQVVPQWRVRHLISKVEVR